LDKKSPFYSFQRHSRAFLERAREALRQFDETENAESFFLAALWLRFGIEARVTEYLEVALNRKGMKLRNVSKFTASLLLKRLADTDLTSKVAGAVRITDEQNGSQIGMRYTPVRPELASIHGRLGALLHYRFFVQNEHWYIRDRLAEKGHASLADLRDVIEKGISGLEYSTSGTLLGNVQFEQLVDEVMHSEAEPDAQP